MDDNDAGGWIDIGHGHAIKPYAWAPDRSIEANRTRYEGLGDLDVAGYSVRHLTPAGEPCIGAVTLDVMAPMLARSTMERERLRPVWRVEQTTPLTLSPSLLCSCGDHGFIRDGHWVPA